MDIRFKTIAITGITIASTLLLNSCSMFATVEKTSSHKMWITGMSGKSQYGAAVSVDLTALKLIDIGGYAEAINQYRPEIESIITNAAANIPASSNEEELAAAIELALEKQLPEIGAETLGFIEAGDVTVLAAFDYNVGSKASLAEYLASNGSTYTSGSVSGIDTDGDGQVSGQANRAKVLPGQSDAAILLCSVQGTGCKLKEGSNSITPMFVPGIGNVPVGGGMVAPAEEGEAQ